MPCSCRAYPHLRTVRRRKPESARKSSGTMWALSVAMQTLPLDCGRRRVVLQKNPVQPQTHSRNGPRGNSFTL